MSLLPENAVTQADLAAWYEMSKQIQELKGKEMLLRQKIFKGLFKDPKEGTNSLDLPDGYVLKGKRTVNREVDPGSLQAMREEFAKAGIVTDAVVQYKPSLKISEYRTLTEEQRKLFDQALIVKDGAPALEIVLPKRRQG